VLRCRSWAKDGERGGDEAPGPRSDVGFRLDQQTAGFKAAPPSRVVRWSPLPEEKQNHQLARIEFRFIQKMIITIAREVITCCPSNPHQRSTAAKDGKLQGCDWKQIQTTVQWLREDPRGHLAMPGLRLLATRPKIRCACDESSPATMLLLRAAFCVWYCARNSSWEDAGAIEAAWAAGGAVGGN
jgi:hypothetical protein